jgi:hypothetical protein
MRITMVDVFENIVINEENTTTEMVKKLTYLINNVFKSRSMASIISAIEKVRVQAYYYGLDDRKEALEKLKQTLYYKK